jgi:excisionase family DNA binding protein
LRDYFKIAKASKFLGVSQNTLRKWADQGQIEHYRIGHDQLIHSEDPTS